MRHRRLVILATLLVICVVMTGTTLAFGEEPPPGITTGITIGLIPEINIFSQVARFRPLANYLEQETGVTVHLEILSRYGNIIESFLSIPLDGAFFGSFTGALAIEKLGAIPVVRPVNEDGHSTYFGYLFSRKDSGISSVPQMRGKRMAFVERATTAGYIFPLAYLKERGVASIEDFFAEHYFTGSHDNAILDVLEGRADVGAAKNTVFQMLLRSEPRVGRELAILARSPRVPSNGLLLSQRVPAALREKIRTALLDMEKTAAGKDILDTLHYTRFIPTGDEDFESVKALANRAGIDMKDYQYQNR